MSYYILPLEIREMIALKNIEVFRYLQLVDKELYQFISQNKIRYSNKFNITTTSIINDITVLKTVTPFGVIHGPFSTSYIEPLQGRSTHTSCNFYHGELKGTLKFFVDNKLFYLHFFYSGQGDYSEQKLYEFIKFTTLELLNPEYHLFKPKVYCTNYLRDRTSDIFSKGTIIKKRDIVVKSIINKCLDN